MRKGKNLILNEIYWQKKKTTVKVPYDKFSTQEDNQIIII